MMRKEWDATSMYGKDDNYRGNDDHGVKRARLEGILGIGKKSMFQALKIARGFERQKLGRRQKQAKQKEDTEESTRLEAEVAALKGLDLSATAEKYVYKTLAKMKPISDSPAFATYILGKFKDNEPPRTAAIANVTARLYNSNPAKEAVSEIIESVQECLGIKKAPVLKRKKRLRTADYKSNGTGENLTLQGDMDKRTGKSVNIAQLSKEGDKATLESPAEEVRSDDSDEYKHCASRLANSSSSDESTISEGQNNRDSRRNSFSPIRSPTLGTLSPKTAKTSNATTGVRSTTFLPSLTVGSYLSGSDSDPSDIESGGDVKRRKNRMGQQARRQLWEKKYGRTANHLKNESRFQGRDSSNTLQGGNQRGLNGRRGEVRGRGRSSETRHNGRNISGANGDPLGKQPPKTNTNAVGGTLHPSWEAAKRKKEVKMNVAFEGKKIVFE